MKGSKNKTSSASVKDRPKMPARRRRINSAPPPQRLPWPAIAFAEVSSSQESKTPATTPVATTKNAVVTNESPSVVEVDNSNSTKKPASRRREGGGITFATTTTTTTIGTQKSNRNRRLAVKMQSSSPPSPEQLLWIDAHAPTQAADLCVAPKKINELRDWINPKASSSSRTPGLLIVVGSPGIGKSTTVRVVAQEMGYNLLEWTDSVSSHYRQPASTSDGARTMFMSQSTPMDSFEMFLQQSRVGYSSIVAITTTTSVQLPTKPIQSQSSGKKRPRSKSSSLSTTDMVDRCRMASDKSSTTEASQSIVLLEELPNLHGAEMEERFRRLFTQHVVESSTTNPPAGRTILIWSNVTEGKHHKDDLERLIEPTILYDPRCCQILQIHPPTKSRFTKMVDRVAAQRNLLSLNTDALYEGCNGDLRSAINTLQFERDGNVDTQNSTKAANRSVRDERLNPFHALGKLLYAKRVDRPRSSSSSSPLSSQIVTIPARWHDTRPPLAYDPDSVVERCEMDLPRALQFLEYHAVDFLTDITDLSHVLSCYSDAAWLCDQRVVVNNSGTSGSSSTQQQYRNYEMGAALAGRAAATFNHHPSPHRFRQFTSPKIFEVMGKRSTNEASLRHALSRSIRLLGVGQYATDCLAFVRRIQPGQLSMSSFFEPSSSDSRFMQSTVEDEATPLVIEDDDVADFSDHEEDSWLRNPKPSLQLKTTVAGVGDSNSNKTASTQS